MRIVEWEIVSKCNYKCNYCLLPNYDYIKDKIDIKNFIKMLNENYNDIEIFCFGGEPFLHKDIKYIINTFNEFDQKFVIQSNLSNYSIMKIIKNNIGNFKLNGSIHPSQINIKSCIDDFKLLFEYAKDNNVYINSIDIMYSSSVAIRYFNILNDIFPKVFKVVPIAGFYEEDSDNLTSEYNSAKSIYRNVKFENILNTQYGMQRSDVWEKQNKGEISPYGKSCYYNDNYILYDSMFIKYNCCYRENNNICNHTKCFCM